MPVRPSCDLAITRATVLSAASGWTPAHGCDLVIDAGRFVAIGAGRADAFSAARTIDGRGLVVLPGLVNAHTHSTESLARGLADGAPLPRWIEAVWQGLDAAPLPTIDLGVRLAAGEMLRSGVTTVVDHFRQTPQRTEAIDAAALAWQATGMRCVLAPMVRDRGVPPWVPSVDEGACSIDRQLAACVAAVDRWHRTGTRLQVAFGPSAPTRCSDALLQALHDIATDRSLRMHMHVDEVREDTISARAAHGTTSVARLAALGMLGPRLSIAHAVWVTDDDLDLLGATGTTVVHNPVSNLRLGSGRAPVEKMLERGIPVTVGTDGAASNDTQHLLEAVKLATLLPRMAVPDPAAWPTARSGLAMITTVAAHALGLGAGDLIEGAAADFAAFDLDEPPLVPAHDLATQVVLAGAALRARHVAVDGQLLVYDRAITSFDEAAVISAARAGSTGRA